MANFDHSTVTTVVERFEMSEPVAIGEFFKAHAAARQRLEAVGKDPSYDDSMWVRGDGESVWIEIETSKESTP